MAKLSDVPARHRRHAESVPDEILHALSAAELRHRCAYAAELEDSARSMSPELYRRTLLRARKALLSEPVWEHVQHQRKLMQMAQEAPSREIASDYFHARAEHSEKHHYPPGLTTAIESQYDKRPMPAELATVAAAIVAHHDRG